MSVRQHTPSRRPLFPRILLAALALVAGPALRAAEPADLLLTNVHVVDVERGEVLRDRAVAIDDGRIVRMVRLAAADAEIAAARTVDGAGGYLIPGLWDLHAHLRADGLPDWITTDWMMPLLLAHGVTGVRDMKSGCDGPEEVDPCFAKMKRWQAQVEVGELAGPRIVAMASAFVNPPWDHEVTEEQARGLVRKLAGDGFDLVKIYTRLSPEAMRWMGDEAAKAGIAIAGHVPLRATSVEASNAGFTSIEHARAFLFDCFPGSAGFRATATSHDSPVETLRAMVEEHDPARCREVFRTLAENGTAYVPTHVTRRMDAYADDPDFRNDPRESYLPPALWQQWQRDADRMAALDPSLEGRRAMRRFYEMGLELTGAAHDAGVTVLVGSDGGDTYAFPGSGVHDELGELVKAGLTPAEALRAATSRSAALLGRSEDHGTVEVGKVADLVLLGADPLESIENVRKIRAVVFGGEVLDRDRLDAMLEAVEEAAKRPLGGG
jgi:cytosine/adenosine deaminase-related metal-dependent hydrolase